MKVSFLILLIALVSFVHAYTFTKCTFSYCSTIVPETAQIMFANPTNLPAGQYMLGTFQKAATTSLAVDIGCADAVAWVMLDNQYTAMTNGDCTYSSGTLTGCEYYHSPVVAGSALHIDVPLTGGPGVNLNYVLYNPSASDCTITRGHWHATQSNSKLTTIIIIVVFLVLLGGGGFYLYRRKKKMNASQANDKQQVDNKL